MDILTKITLEKPPTYLLGDFNIDLLLKKDLHIYYIYWVISLLIFLNMAKIDLLKYGEDPKNCFNICMSVCLWPNFLMNHKYHSCTVVQQ